MTGSCFSVCRGASELYCSARSLYYHVFVILEHDIFCKCETVPFFLLSVVPLWVFFDTSRTWRCCKTKIYISDLYCLHPDPDLGVMQNPDLVRCLLFPLVVDLYMCKSGNMRKSVSNCVTWPLVLKGTVSRFFFLFFSFFSFFSFFLFFFFLFFFFIFFFFFFFFVAVWPPVQNFST